MIDSRPGSVGLASHARRLAMIELGLARIARLLQHVPLPWRAIHVAGTNGKGSICAYASAMVRATGLRSARFTSPHVIDRWDCITVDEHTVDQSIFRAVENEVHQRNQTQKIGASEFELLTATAFEVFTREKVDVALIEVGMGGRLDATNILTSPSATVIAKIGLDHQSFLGNTIKEIALQKAGILKPQVPCVVDATNETDVLTVLSEHAKAVSAGPIIYCPSDDDDFIWKHVAKESFEPHQQVNLSCAYRAVKVTLEASRMPSDPATIIPAIKSVQWPGRLQNMSIQNLTGRRPVVLLDGAHNVQSAKVLASYVDRRLRKPGRSVTWLIAASEGKDVDEIFSLLIRPQDHVVTVQFGSVDGMPWVRPHDSSRLLDSVSGGVKPRSGKLHDSDSDVLAALRWASETSADGPLVIAGSLYLVSDVLRLGRASDRTSKHYVK